MLWVTLADHVSLCSLRSSFACRSAREKWNELHGSAHPQPQSQANGQPGNTVQQYSSQPHQQPTQQFQQTNNNGYTFAAGQTSTGFGNSFNASGSLPLASSSVYDNAIRISSPRLQEDGVNIPSTVQRRVVRQVEVPFTRQVSEWRRIERHYTESGR